MGDAVLLVDIYPYSTASLLVSLFVHSATMCGDCRRNYYEDKGIRNSILPRAFAEPAGRPPRP